MSFYKVGKKSKHKETNFHLHCMQLLHAGPLLLLHAVLLTEASAIPTRAVATRARRRRIAPVVIQAPVFQPTIETKSLVPSLLLVCRTLERP